MADLKFGHYTSLGHIMRIESKAPTRVDLAGGTLDSSVSNLVLSSNNPVDLTGNFTFAGTQNLNAGTGAITDGARSQPAQGYLVIYIDDTLGKSILGTVRDSSSAIITGAELR